MRWWEKLMEGKGADDGDDSHEEESEFELDAEGEQVLDADGKPVAKKKEEKPLTEAERAVLVAKEIRRLDKEEADETARVAAEKKRKEAKPASDGKLETMRARVAEIEEDAFQDTALFKELNTLNREIAKAEAKAETMDEFNKSVGSRLDFADDIAAQQDLNAALEPLDEGERAAAIDYIREKGIQPEYLKNAVVVDMIQAKARLINFEKTGVMNEKPIPGATGTRGKAAPDTSLQSGDEANIVKGLERVAQRMSAKQAPGSKPIKLDRGELTGRKN